jgi:hypothetical protein
VSQRGGLKQRYRDISVQALILSLAPVIWALRRENGFVLNNQSYKYFYSRYQNTWMNERAVEIPVARAFISNLDPGDILEVGNVLPHYFNVSHEVVDKYEPGPHVTQCDIVEFKPARKYKAIVSISTLEHVGFDESGFDVERDPGKVGEAPEIGKTTNAFRHLMELLADDGKLLITVPACYNPYLDRALGAGDIGLSSISCMQRLGFGNHWTSCSFETALRRPYSRRLGRANALVIGNHQRST